ncbi:hypothetical protein, partial [Nonomuraea sp. NPDC049129]|uniref:RICIN domain-containing protein n=1 Tax=Nonomuraea sp. NPDC049129 TaxID=3155272 RepID=UPI0033DA8FDA
STGKRRRAYEQQDPPLRHGFTSCSAGRTKKVQWTKVPPAATTGRQTELPKAPGAKPMDIPAPPPGPGVTRMSTAAASAIYPFLIEAGNSNLYLSASGNIPNSTTVVWPQNGTTGQTWWVPDTPYCYYDGPYQRCGFALFNYRAQNEGTGRTVYSCLNVDASAMRNNTNVLTWNCDDGVAKNEIWEFYLLANGRHALKPAWTGGFDYSANVAGGIGKNHSVVLWKDNLDNVPANSQWQLYYLGD